MVPTPELNPTLPPPSPRITSQLGDRGPRGRQLVIYEFTVLLNLQGHSTPYLTLPYLTISCHPTTAVPTNLNNMTTNTPQPLKVLIVGGGIGGLTAGLALRRQGHDVQIFEQSRLATETGAALHLAPNANGILKRLGIFAEEFGANLMERVCTILTSPHF